MQQTEQVRYADYSEWRPEDYLTDYYSEVMPDERFALEFLVDWAEKTGSAPLALEFGCGPTVHHLFPVARFAGEIHMAEYLESNREEVNKWLRRDPAAHDWRPFMLETLRLEGHASPTEAEAQAREEEVRARVTKVLPGDARDANPLGTEGRSAYPLVWTHYCAEGVTTDKGEWHSCMRNILSLVAPGGAVMLSACGAANYYCVGDRYFPCAGVTAQDILTSFKDNGFGDADLRIRLVPAHTELGYSSVIFARAVRMPERAAS